jgi:hypothetical protein
LFLSLCLIDGVTLFSSLSLLLVAINDFSGRSSSASNSYDRCYCGEGWAMVTAVVVVVAGGGETFRFRLDFDARLEYTSQRRSCKTLTLFYSFGNVKRQFSTICI